MRSITPALVYLSSMLSPTVTLLSEDIPNKQKSLLGQLKRNLRLSASSSVQVVAATSKTFKSRYNIFK